MQSVLIDQLRCKTQFLQTVLTQGEGPLMLDTDDRAGLFLVLEEMKQQLQSLSQPSANDE